MTLPSEAPAPPPPKKKRAFPKKKKKKKKKEILKEIEENQKQHAQIYDT